MKNKKLELEAIELIEKCKLKFKKLKDLDIRPVVLTYEETSDCNGELIKWPGAVTICERTSMAEIIILPESEWSKAPENCWLQKTYDLEKTIMTAMIEILIWQYNFCMVDDSEMFKFLLSDVLMGQNQEPTVCATV